MKSVIVIGSGFAGLSSATFLAKAGYDVTVLEKNDSLGGRARVWETQGFKFDMGPSWYWMPDVFERYFKSFGYDISDLYELVRLNPSYRVVFGPKDHEDQSASMAELEAMFERLDPGSSERLKKFLAEAAYKYEVGIKDLVHKPSRSLLEFVDFRILKGLFQLDLLKDMRKHVAEVSTHPKLKAIMEFPVLFLGALPQNTPALYSLMNYADMSLGTWYPRGGMHKIIEAMVKVAKEQGVKFRTKAEVKGFKYSGNKIVGVLTKTGGFSADIVVAGADYHHIDQEVSDEGRREYSKNYWNKRKMAPSSLLYYLGIKGEVPNVLHHNLFFDHELDQHASELYTHPQWPTKPLFYASAPTKTDRSIAPEGCENMFLLMPTAPGLAGDSEEVREKYYDIMMDRLEQFTGSSIRDRVVVKRSFAYSDFKSEYNSFKGNAYGLANTLDQTAILKPRLKSKKINNLYFSGQLTTPGPGVPPTLISGEVVSKEIAKDFKLK
ncbi:MAG: phytoene desaturase family protein [Schleiferiaceae bacterium]|nr:phytoene desaturase family protein [Schleiferiaceae bacterium]